MRHVLRNITGFWRHEKMIFFVMLLCILCSAIILNFSYGLYQNYNTQKIEAELDLNSIAPTINADVAMTKGDLQMYAESLSADTLNAMYVIYATAELEEFPFEAGAGAFYMRFTLRDGTYQICEETKEAYEKKGILTSGRYISNEEEAAGAFVALVASNGADWDTYSEAIRTGENTISLFGQTYQVIGTYNGGSANPIVPFRTVPDKLIIDGFGFSFYKNITRSQYEELKEKAEEILPGVLTFEELQFPDTDTVYLYNNIMYISVLIALLSAINFAMLYLYMIKKRRKDLAIFRICGCTRSTAIRIYLGECVLISVPVYLIGTGVYVLIMKLVLSDIFEYMEDAYSLPVYFAIFAIYLLSMFLILELVLRKMVTKDIMDGLKGGSI